MRNRYLLAAMIAFLAVSASGQEAGDAPALPEGGTSLLGDNPIEAVEVTEGDLGAATVVTVPFASVLRVETKSKPSAIWDFQGAAEIRAGVKEGDTLHARFWARAVETSDESGEARSEFVFEMNGPPHSKSAALPVGVGREWKLFDAPFRSRADYGPGEARVCFRFGYKPQTIEIAGLQLVNYGDSVDVDDLPRTSLSYRGQEEDAAWRAAAAANIEKHRKGGLRVVVKTADGEPAEGAEVTVRMTRHAYGFGSALNSRFLAGEGEDVERYKKEFVRLFNKAVLENGHKWGRWDSDSRQVSIDATEWLLKNKIEVRGHCLVWPSWTHVPDRLRELEDDPEALAGEVRQHIRDLVGYFEGRITEWDVINETVRNHDLMDVLGRESMVDWFRVAREEDPEAVLYLNEYGLVAGAYNMDRYEENLQFLIDNGAPVGGIGTQCHFGAAPTGIPEVLETLDRLAKYEMPIQVTELDIDSNDGDLQADYMRDFMTAFFSHPSTNGILMWGFWDGAHWRQNAPIFRRDWSIKPGGQAWIDLVFDEWWTEEEGLTDAGGAYEARGFLGRYEVVAVKGGLTAKSEVVLGPEGRVVELTLP